MNETMQAEGALKASAFPAKEKEAIELIKRARTRLILAPSHCFLAVLSMRLELEANWQIDTMATDGKKIYFNPEFTLAMGTEEGEVSSRADLVLGVVVHEIYHCVFAHFGRRGERDKKLFNIACDLAINSLIVRQKFALPICALLPGKKDFAAFPDGLSAEEYYGLLQQQAQQQKQNQQQDGQGGQGDEKQDGQADGKPQDQADGQAQDDKPSDDPGGCGEVLDGPDDEAQAKELESDWKVAVTQAANEARERGQFGSDLEIQIGSALEARVDWRAALQEFILRRAKSDYRWSRPNRRMLAHGLYLPSLDSQELGRIAITIDTSGSISPKLLEHFAGEINAVLDLAPCGVDIFYHHIDMYCHETWTPAEGPLVLNKGKSGGTSHRDVFKKISDLTEQPDVVICLTDMESDFPDDCDIPTLWCSTLKGKDAPFGEIIFMDL